MLQLNVVIVSQKLQHCHLAKKSKLTIIVCSCFPFGASTLLDGRQEGHPDVGLLMVTI